MRVLTPYLLLAALGACRAEPRAPESQAGASTREVSRTDEPPGSPPSAPSVRVEPHMATVRQGESIQLRARTVGLDDGRVTWQVVDSRGVQQPRTGSVSPDGVYTAGETRGKYFFVRAMSVADPRLFDAAWIEVVSPDYVPREVIWTTHVRAGWTLHCEPEAAADAERIASLVDRSLAELRGAFADRDPDRLLEGVELHVYLHGEPDGDANVGTMTIHTCDGRAALHLLAPRAHPGVIEGGWPRGYDELYFHKNLVHELSTPYFEALTERKAVGWRFHSAPAWFVQGIEEYLAASLTHDDARLARHRDAVRDDPTRVSADFEVRGVYGDGCALVHFLFDEFGRDAVFRLLESPELDFWAAVATELDVDRAALYERFTRWRDGE